MANGLIRQLAKIYGETPMDHPGLKPVTFAQWLLESGRGSSPLAAEHLNFGGLKWRPEMTGIATEVTYTDSKGETDAYCRFATMEDFIAGYWRFIGRSPYAGWQGHAQDGGAFVRFIGPIYCPSNPDYAQSVLRLVPEAERNLGGEFAAPAMHAATARSLADSIRLGTVVIDAGHGGPKGDNRPGSSWNNTSSVSGVLEKELTLAYALALRDSLEEQAGANGETLDIVMTRTTDVNLSAADRAGLVKKHKADAFIIFHFNGVKDPSARGPETYYRAPAKGNVNAAADIAFCGQIHAALVRGLAAAGLAGKDRGLKPDTLSGPGGIMVLRDDLMGNAGKDGCVAAYLEVDFVTNPTVDKALVSGPKAAANRKTIAAEIAASLRKYLREKAAA